MPSLGVHPLRTLSRHVQKSAVHASNVLIGISDETAGACLGDDIGYVVGSDFQY
ncbi:MAG: hypothetical protein JWQ58_386 [Reyranella sp.]|nr:hypothetical protein [Reyranella sp.]